MLRHLWRSFVIKFYWHKTIATTQCGHDVWYVSCDPYETGCLLGCRRQRKLAAWEAKDAARALPKARVL